MKLFSILLLLVTSLAQGKMTLEQVAPAGVWGFRPEEEAFSQVTAWNFDWDDNAFRLKTKIILFRKGSSEEVGLTTEEFAHYRDHIGKDGEFADYEFRGEESFRNFRSRPWVEGQAYFNPLLTDLKEAIAAFRANPLDPAHDFRGPAYQFFAQALRQANTARRTTIITARGHSTEDMVEAMNYLIVESRRLFNEGLIPESDVIHNAIPRTNLFAVSHPSIKASAADPSKAKVEFMKFILDRIQATLLSDDAIPVANQAGTGMQPLHLWGFSDDDPGNVRTAIAELGSAMRENPARWSRIKIKIFYTGSKPAPDLMHTAVLSPGGVPRFINEVDRSSRREAERIVAAQMASCPGRLR